MDPIVGVGILVKLIDLGMKGVKALDDRSFDSDDLQAVRAALDTGASLLGKKKEAVVTPATAQLALVVLAFGQAIQRHLRFHGLLGSDAQERKERERRIQLHIESVKLRVRDLGVVTSDETEHLAQLTGSPLGTPYYRILWQAFATPTPSVANPDGTTPLQLSGSARRDFERHFLLAYNEILTSPLGRGVNEHLAGLSGYRTQRVRELLVADLATWGERHVFGNVPREDWNESDAIPFMPLDAMYVEPRGTIVDKRGSMQSPEPLLQLIEQLVAPDAPQKVIVVMADFGSGKSLSARTAAQRWAGRFLEEPSSSLDLPLPIYVRCAEDLAHGQLDLPATVQNAGCARQERCSSPSPRVTPRSPGLQQNSSWSACSTASMRSRWARYQPKSCSRSCLTGAARGSASSCSLAPARSPRNTTSATT